MSVRADGALLVRVKKGGGLADASGRQRWFAGSDDPLEGWGSLGPVFRMLENTLKKIKI